MNKEYTKCVASILNRAKRLAEDFRSKYVGTSHVLLAIFEEEAGIAYKIIEEHGIRVEDVLPYIQFGKEKVKSNTISFSPKYYEMLENAEGLAEEYGINTIGSDILFYGLIKQVDSEAVEILQKFDFDFARAYREISKSISNENVEEENEESNSLRKYGINYNELVKNKKITKVIGREKELQRVIQILLRKNKNNPCLTGEAGVGKTALVEGIAYKIENGEVPIELKDKIILGVDLSSIVAGSKYRGEFEERMKNIINEAIQNPNIILFFDELHTIIGAGSTEGSLDAANILKPLLARGEVQIIGATTTEEYRKYILKDAALDRRFQEVFLEEPTIKETEEILLGIKEIYEDYHKIGISNENIKDIVELSSKYITGRFMPDKAIDVLDEACGKEKLKSELSSKKNKKKNLVEIEEALKVATSNADIKNIIKLTKEKEKLVSNNKNVRICSLQKETILEVVSSTSRVPVTALSTKEKEIVKNLEDNLKTSIIGQDEAIETLARAIKRQKAGLKDVNKPIGSFMLIGPSGSGKTYTCKVLAELLFGSKDSLIKFDMSEYSESHSVSKLIGSPPGYVGFGEGGKLTEAVKKKPYSIVLFDEIEKAHPDIYNILLQILDDGTLTDSVGRKIDFKNTIIMMTSNEGVKDVFQGKSIGFNTFDSGDESYKKEKKEILEQLKKKFSIEFLNRLDDVLVFKKLNKQDIQKITKMEIKKTKDKLKENGIKVRVDISNEIVDKIVGESLNAEFGARPIARAIIKNIEEPLAEFILSKDISDKIKVIKIDQKNGKTLVTSKKE